MHSVRSELYTLAAGLFKIPKAGRDRAIHCLASDILQNEIPECPWRPHLKAVAQDLGQEGPAPAHVVAEYVRLFVFPPPYGAAPPFASSWLQNGERHALEIEEAMCEHGFTLTAEPSLMADHVAVELEFMAHLIQSRPRGAQRSFLCHLAGWVPRFSHAIRGAEPLRRFALAADFLDHLIGWDRRQLTGEQVLRAQTASHTDRATT